MSNPWVAEIGLIAGLAAAALLMGWLSGHVLLFLWLVTLGYLVFHIYQIYRLEQWLSTGAGALPDGGQGVWGEIFYQFHRLRQRHRQRKRTIAQYLQRFRELTAAMPDATVVLSTGGEIEWFNDAAGRLLGLRMPQDSGRRIMNLVRHPAFAEHLRSLNFSEPVEFPSPVNESVMLSVSVVPYGKEQILLVARDNTRLHRLEQVRRDFVANVSHELRTPLTVISGFLETLSDDPKTVPAETQHALRLMSQQTARMQHIVEDLLLLARLESEKNPVRQEPVLVPMMLRVLHEEARVLSANRHTLHLDVDEGLFLKGNQEELRSAFTNLISNAVRYTPVGGTVHIRWYADEAGAHFDVRDTGVGIAEHDIPRLTERFYRVDAARSRQSGGTGLGLAIVKHVLERHGAGLRITSKPGAGSCFVCDFPASALLRQDSSRTASVMS